MERTDIEKNISVSLNEYINKVIFDFSSQGDLNRKEMNLFLSTCLFLITFKVNMHLAYYTGPGVFLS